MPSYQIIFFVIGMVCSLPVLVWYYRRHQHPKFRPKFGEMVMVSLFAVLLSLTGSWLIGGLMDDPDQFRTDSGLSTMPGLPSDGGTGPGDDADADNRKSSGRGEAKGRERSGSAGESRGLDRR